MTTAFVRRLTLTNFRSYRAASVEVSSQLVVLTELVHRWTPDHLNDQPLKEELVQIQTRTREFFERVFR